MVFTIQAPENSHRQPSMSDPSRTTKNVAVLGATGSIGTATIDVLENLDRVDPIHRWRLWAASGHRNLDALSEIAQKSIVASPAADSLRSRGADQFDACRTHWRTVRSEIGPDELVAAAQHDCVDIVVAAIVGRAGLESTLAAVDAGKRVALANKETMVVAGPSGPSRQVSESGAELLPVDSEHSAIFQCLGTSRLDAQAIDPDGQRWTVSMLLEAGNGGRDTESALAHPTWEMGPKITIDSATMMNKSLEIIEARWLFDLPAEAIEVVVHPQSIIHSMVEFEDGSVIAQLSPPDMRLADSICSDLSPSAALRGSAVGPPSKPGI